MQLQLRTTLAGFRNLLTTEEPGLYCTDVYLPYSFAAGLLSILMSLALTIPRSVFSCGKSNGWELLYFAPRSPLPAHGVTGETLEDWLNR
jgi:hypothetical protein